MATTDPNSIVDTLKTQGQDSSLQNRASLYEKSGLGKSVDYVGSVEQNTSLNNYYKNTSPVPIVTSNQSQTTYNKQVSDLQTGLNNLKIGIEAYAKEKETTPTEKKTTTTAENKVTDSLGNTYDLPEGVDPDIAKSLVGNLDAATSEIESYKKQIETLGSYDVNTDPVAVAAANSIRQSYDVLIKQMGDKNKMLMGSITTNAARGGMLQYANQMDSMFKNAEFDKATQRIADLEQKKMDAINQSNNAYKSGNVKLLDQAMKEYNDSQKESRTALLDLQKTINDQIKSNQAQAKIDQANIKAQQALDISTSKSIAQAVLDEITQSGVTDQEQIDAYINDVAMQNGITNPAFLKGELSALNPQSGTAALKNQNIISQMNKREKVGDGTDKTADWNAAKKFISDNPDATYEQLDATIREKTKALTDGDITSLLSAVNKTKSSKLTRKSVADIYDIPDNDEKTGWFGSGKTNKEKLDEVMNTIKEYQAIGYTDSDIIKLIKE